MNKLRQDRKRDGSIRVQSNSFSERDGHRLEAILEGTLESAFGSGVGEGDFYAGYAVLRYGKYVGDTILK